MEAIVISTMTKSGTLRFYKDTYKEGILVRGNMTPLKKLSGRVLTDNKGHFIEINDDGIAETINTLLKAERAIQ